MQYTQQQRLAPEVPDESALYSPITAINNSTNNNSNNNNNNNNNTPRFQYAKNICLKNKSQKQKLHYPINLRLNSNLDQILENYRTLETLNHHPRTSI